MRSFYGALSLLVLAACSGQSTFKKDEGGSALAVDPDPGIVNQAPKLSCLITNRQRPSLTRRIDINSEMDTFFAENPKEGETLDFDCSATTDESPTGLLRFAVDDNYDVNSPQWSNVQVRFSIPLTQYGTIPMAISVEDPEGAKALKTFTMIVQCATEIRPNLNLAGVRVTPGSKLNFFRYAVDPGSLSGGNSFSYAWDFNGDGVFDTPSASSGNEVWTNQNSLSNIYTIFESPSANPRKIGLRIRNQCNYESSFRVGVAQPIPNIPRNNTAEAVVKGYHYLQSNIRHGANASNQRLNGDYITTWYAGDSPKRVKCDYKFLRTGQKAVFTIEGLNNYRAATATSFQHGLTVGINAIPDNGSTGLQVYSNAQGVRVNNARYLASAGDDGTRQEIFDRIQSTCEVTFRLERMQALAPCAADKRDRADFSETGAVILRGEFNCPKIVENNSSRNIAAQSGKFFCEVAPVNQCVGGGGGGGNPPPEQ